MSNTKAGGKKVSVTLKSKYGENYFKEMGAIGGKVKNPNKGFGSLSPEERREMGSRGKRGSAKIEVVVDEAYVPDSFYEELAAKLPPKTKKIQHPEMKHKVWNNVFNKLKGK